MKIHLGRLLVVLLLHLATCAANQVSASPSLADRIARADSAYRSLSVHYRDE